MNTVYIVIEKESLDSMGGYSTPNKIEMCFDTRKKAEDYLQLNHPKYFYNFYIKECIVH